MPSLSEYLGNSSCDTYTSTKKKTYFMSFALGSVPVESTQLAESVNFSENPAAAVYECELENFAALIDLIKMAKLTPRMQLDRRVKEVVRFVMASNPKKIADNKWIITNYLNQFIFENIVKLLTDKNVKQINLTYLLGLHRYTKDITSIRNLQRVLLRIKKMQASSGFINKINQEEVKKYYGELWNSFITGIEEKYFPENKRGILTTGELPSTIKGHQIADEPEAEESEKEVVEFSATNEIHNKIESILLNNMDHVDNIESELSKVRLSATDEKKLLNDPVLGDEDITELIIKFIKKKIKFDEIKKYINTVSKSFSITTGGADVFDKYVGDQYSQVELATDKSSIANMSIGVVPLPITWNDDRTEAYYGINDKDHWYYFRLNPERTSVLVKKFPVLSVSYGFRSIDDEDKTKLILDDKYDYYKEVFKSVGESESFIEDICRKLAQNEFANFSEEVDWKKDSDEIIVGFKRLPSLSYSFVAYKTVSGKYVLEIRTLPANYDYSKFNLESLVSQKSDLTKEFSSKEELKTYCDKLDKVNES